MLDWWKARKMHLLDTDILLERAFCEPFKDEWRVPRYELMTIGRHPFSLRLKNRDTASE
jgi:nicotinamide riboside kinase